MIEDDEKFEWPPRTTREDAEVIIQTLCANIAILNNITALALTDKGFAALYSRCMQIITELNQAILGDAEKIKSHLLGNAD